MKFKERYIFGFKSELHPATILWRYTDEAEYQANNHKTYKPKVSDLVIMNQDLPKQLKIDIRHELLSSILQDEAEIPQKRP
tara:strand:+ start:260 stop:502 length:243 start_codon:yes stop_codon:yes gene_type:complete